MKEERTPRVGFFAFVVDVAIESILKPYERSKFNTDVSISHSPIIRNQTPTINVPKRKEEETQNFEF